MLGNSNNSGFFIIYQIAFITNFFSLYFNKLPIKKETFDINGK